MKRKTVAVCGSMKFLKEMQEVCERLELENRWTALGVTQHVLSRGLTDAEKELLGELHLRKIDLADAVFIVNVGGYAGDSVLREIEYAKRLGKEILYLENPMLREDD